MNEYRRALLATSEEDYGQAIDSVNRGLDTAYSMVRRKGKAPSKSIHSVHLETSNPVLLISSLHTLKAGIMYRQQRWEDSLQEYLAAHRVLKSTLPTTGRLQISFLTKCIGACHIQMENYSEAIAWLEKGIKQLMAAPIIRATQDVAAEAQLRVDSSIVLAGLHSILSVCYIKTAQPVEALVHAKFVHRRLSSCASGTKDHARATVLLAECMIYASGTNRSTLATVLELLASAAKTYKDLIRILQRQEHASSDEKRDLGAWLINTYFLTARVLLLTNSKKNAELYAYKAEKLLRGMGAAPDSPMCTRIEELIHQCQYGVPYSSLVSKAAPDTRIKSDLYHLLDPSLRERLGSDAVLADMVHEAAQVIIKSIPDDKKGRNGNNKRAVSAPLIANPAKANHSIAQIVKDEERRNIVTRGSDRYRRVWDTGERQERMEEAEHIVKWHRRHSGDNPTDSTITTIATDTIRPFRSLRDID